MLDADTILISEETLGEDFLDALADKLNQQPTWSELPVLFVCTGGPESSIAKRAMETLRGILVLNRPMHLASLSSALRMTLRTRSRQYQLRDAMENIKILSGLLPICASCKKIRDDKGYWNQIEAYIRDHPEAEFTHSTCPDCVKVLYPDLK